MTSRFYGWTRIAPLGCLLVCSASCASGQEKGAVHTFRVTVASQLEMSISGQKQRLTADTEIRYNWQQTGSEKTLQFKEMAATLVIDGKERLNTVMNRAKVVNVIDGKTSEVLFENAPDAARRMLQDSFEVPLCKVQVDETGQEIKRTIIAGPGAKSLLDHGTIGYAGLFHAPFVADGEVWVADSECSTGQGEYVKGKLTLTKMPANNSLVSVKVSGTLTNEGFKRAGSPLVIKNARYLVSGEQSFDLALHEWVSGKRTMDVTMELLDGDKPIGSIKGTLVFAFEKLPAKE